VSLPVGVGAGPLSPEAQARLARPAVPEPAPPAMDDLAAVAAWRQAVHQAWLAGDPPPAETGHRVDVVAGVRCLRAGPATGPLVVYLHGGGYALGSPEVAVSITRRLAVDAEVVSVDYRLAPEHPYPAALDDTLAVHCVVAAGDQRRPVVLAGDSAGANLAVSCALAIGRAGGPAPIALVLLSPHLAHRRPDPAGHDPAARLGDVDAAAGDWLSAAYCGSRRPDDPAVSPLYADLRGLPPTLVQVGGAERLLPQSIRFARLARMAGVDVVLDVWDGMWHTWHYHRELPEADRALAEARAFVARYACDR
jgi:acetyl esterase/lipase